MMGMPIDPAVLILAAITILVAAGVFVWIVASFRRR
jgi:hypothetical protein